MVANARHRGLFPHPRRGVRMRQIRALLVRLAGMFRHSSQEQELAEELESNVAFHVEDNIRAGMSPAEARRQAILKFGGIESSKQAHRDRRGLPFLESCLYDLRFSMRSLARSRIFTMVAVGSLAFGIGSTTVIFTVAKAIFAPPLPYAQSDRLVEISEVGRPSRSTGVNVASADVGEWKRSNTVFSDMAEYVGLDERGKARINLLLTGPEETRVLKGLVVSNNLLNVLGVAPILGRSFRSNDVDRVAILSYECWQNQFGGDAHILGRLITLDGAPSQVIGVMPRGFLFPNQKFDVFILPGEFTPNRIFYDEGVIARLRPGVSIEEARVQMAAIGARLQREFPETNARLSPSVEGWHAALAAPSRPALLMLIAAVAMLFLIVCSNVAHLQFGRAASRALEFAIRMALGAGRGRLVRQLLTENLVLSVLGGMIGLALAAVACVALPRLSLGTIPLYAELRIDSWVVLFNVLVTLLAPLLFGIAPALFCGRSDGLRIQGNSSTQSHRSVRNLLVGG